MACLTKIFDATCGIAANHHELIIKNIIFAQNGDYSFPDLQLHAYHLQSAFDDGSRLVDCFRPNLTYSITRVERATETGEDDERIMKALLHKITASVLVDDLETNLWSGRAGIIDYVGCITQI